jgi:hypothetical protein
MKPQQPAQTQREPLTERDAQSKCEEQQSKKLHDPAKPGDRGMCEKQTPIQGGE